MNEPRRHLGKPRAPVPNEVKTNYSGLPSLHEVLARLRAGQNDVDHFGVRLLDESADIGERSKEDAPWGVGVRRQPEQRHLQRTLAR
jgi:hypothetical protein